MRFTPAILYAVLALGASASPMNHDQQGSPSSSTTTSAVPATTSATGPKSSGTSASNPGSTGAPVPPPAPFKIGIVQQLMLADTTADRFGLLPDDKNFTFDFNTKQNNPGKGGELILANRKSFPALVGTSLGMAVGRVSACGMNTLHVHPRAAELQLVVKGRLITEMVPENGVLVPDPKDPSKNIRRVIKADLKEFMATPFYQGSLHTQYNPDCEEAVFVAAFPTEDPGTGQVADETFALSDDVIEATFGKSIKGEDIDKVRKSIPANIALGVEQCLKKCNIKKRSV